MIKFLKYIQIFTAIGLLLNLFAHFNLMASLKYETDYIAIEYNHNLSEEEKKEEIIKMNEREQEIRFQQKRIDVLIGVFAILLVGGTLTSIYLKRRNIT